MSVLLASLLISSTAFSQVVGINLDGPQTDALAERLKDGLKCDADLKLTSEVLTECQDNVVALQPQFWQKPSFVIEGFTVSFTLGIVAALTHCMGLCK